METILTSVTRFKSFELHSPIKFNDSLCLITGKNGSGKSRLLEGIFNGNISASINNEIIPPGQIHLLEIENNNNNILNNYINNSLASKITEGILMFLNNTNDKSEIPSTIDLDVSHHGEMYNPEGFKLKEIISRCEHLFNKKIENISADELELSILLHKEIAHGRVHPQQVSLSQLVVNYYQAIRKNQMLNFMSSIGEDVKYFDDHIILAMIGSESPHIGFNEIVNKLFRGKFSITPPNSKTVLFHYSPYLISNSNSERVDINNLSSGEKIIFWLAEKIFEIAYSNPKYIFRNKSLILIDEPDAHLHPEMILDFFSCLKSLHEQLNINLIISTHSPTTVALCPNENIFNLAHNFTDDIYYATLISKDGAISQLLEGVTQMSINPDNNRQIYVENISDDHLYEKFYTAMKNKSQKLDPNISLSFISSGPKLPIIEMNKHIMSVTKDRIVTDRIIELINGDGDCDLVTGTVKSLCKAGNHTVRGLIDWDNRNRNLDDNIVVLAPNYAYSIENLIYDPISIFVYYAANQIPHPYLQKAFPDMDSWRDNLKKTDYLQRVVDSVTETILKKENSRNHQINYLCGINLLGDRDYFIPADSENGHYFEKEVLKSFIELKKVKNSNRPLAYHFVTNITLALLGWEFIHTVFEDAFVKLQR